MRFGLFSPLINEYFLFLPRARWIRNWLYMQALATAALTGCLIDDEGSQRPTRGLQIWPQNPLSLCHSWLTKGLFLEDFPVALIVLKKEKKKLNQKVSLSEERRTGEQPFLIAFFSSPKQETLTWRPSSLQMSVRGCVYPIEANANCVLADVHFSVARV